MPKSSTPGRTKQLSPKPKLPHFDPTYPKQHQVPFPLFCHASGRWTKKMKGRFVYFGYWRGEKKITAEEAVRLFHDQKDDHYAGRKPVPASEHSTLFTLRDLANRFLNEKLRKMEARELSPRTFRDYQRCCKELLNQFGKNRSAGELTPDEFSAYRLRLSKRYSPEPLAREVQMVRTLFKWGSDNELLDRPVRFGSEFKKPSRCVVRRHRQQRPARFFEAAEIRMLIEAAPGHMKAMILLGVNAGLGNTDIADLQMKHLDLDGGWLDYPRPKTTVDRRCPLWKETVEAIKESIKLRRSPAKSDDAECVFLTQQGQRYVRASTVQEVNAQTGSNEIKVVVVNAVTAQFSVLQESVGLKREGVGFLSLRHVLRSIGGGARDKEAVDVIMGHEDTSDMGVTHYRHDFDDGRLLAVTQYVHSWLFDSAVKPTVAKA